MHSTTYSTDTRPRSFIHSLNTRWHEFALQLFMVIVVAHWLEHIFQMTQIWVLGWSRPEAHGMLGLAQPWLVKSETLHYGYALAMVVALGVLLPGFRGAARTWWITALVLQFWHHIEHLLLIVQAQIGQNFFGGDVPTSVLQVWFLRPELHLFYNTVVTLPMIIAVLLHLYAERDAQQRVSCTCARRGRVSARTA